MKRKAWLRHLSDLMFLAGFLVLLGVALFWARSALAAGQTADRRFLASSAGMQLPLPSLTPTPEPSPTPTPEPSPTSSSTPLPTLEDAPPASAVPEGTGPSGSVAVQPPTAVPEIPTATPESPPVAPEFMLPAPIELPPDGGPVVRLEIPALKINRAVVPVGVKKISGRFEWDTDILFATRNRSDLVGQLESSVNPGQPGNILLIGHNYDQGIFAWQGVFVDLKSLQPGDRIIVHTEGGNQHVYIVQQVKKVPWRDQNDDELQKHMKFLGPSESERLTLITCGGANVWPWPARIYVVAIPENASP